MRGEKNGARRVRSRIDVNARLQTEAMRFGDVTFLSDEEIVATADMAASPLACDRVWEYWVRRSGFGSAQAAKSNS